MTYLDIYLLGVLLNITAASCLLLIYILSAGLSVESMKDVTHLGRQIEKLYTRTLLGGILWILSYAIPFYVMYTSVYRLILLHRLNYDYLQFITDLIERDKKF